VVGIGHALDVAHFLAHHAALHQRRDHGGGDAQPREHKGFFRRPELLGQELHQPGLLRRLFAQGRQLVGHDHPGQREILLLLQPRAVAHSGGNHRLQHRFHAGGVVNVHPPRQPDQVRRQGGVILHYPRDGLQFFQRHIGDGVHFQDEPDQVAVEDRYPHKRPAPDVRPQVLRHLVVQELVETRQRLNTHDHARTSARS